MQQNISVRFAGDSGDGMQLIGQQFTYNAASLGWQVQTLPDFPAEIRAPVGTLAGVSGFQISLAEKPLYVSEDKVDVLVVLNPAALKVSLSFLKEGGLLFINADSFKPRDLKKAGLDSFSSDMPWLKAYKVIEVPLISLTQKVLVESELSQSVIKKTKNFYILGMVLWLFQLPVKITLDFLEEKFSSNEALKLANIGVLKAGYHYADTLELSHFPPFQAQSDTRNLNYLSGIDALTKALAFVSVKSNCPMLVAGYPITPATSILHQVALMENYGLSLFQAEDEIAAICAALGAAFSGSLAVTCTSGPGLDLKAEALGLAVMVELPLVIIDVMRSGPSTGLPTKTEQGDLLAAMYNRHGEAPLPIIAPKSPSDCFFAVIDAFKLAVKYMTPVIFLCDAYLANASELWRVPNPDEINIEPPKFNQFSKPYERDENGARSWNIPGAPELMHRIGGLEKGDLDGNVTYLPEDHQDMVAKRESKVMSAKIETPIEFRGRSNSDVLLVTWGSTYGAVRTVVDEITAAGGSVAMLHLRQLFPLVSEIKDILMSSKHIYVCELNQGQLYQLLRAEFLIDIKLISQTNGLPFSVGFLKKRVKELLCKH